VLGEVSEEVTFEGDWVGYLRATPTSVGVQLNVDAAHAVVLVEAVEMVVVASV
jgi:hypothetical protein